MMKEDIETNKTSILFMKNTLHNCYTKVNDIIVLVMRHLKSCKELIEPFTDESSELMHYKKLVSPLTALLDKHTDFFISIKTEYVTKLKEKIKEIEEAKQMIDVSCSSLEEKIEIVLNSLHEVNHLYDHRYQRNIESVQVFADEKKKMEEQSINDSNDSFIKYVLSTKEKNNKQIKKLTFLERSSKDELNKTIELMNNSLENINNIQTNLLPLYEKTMSEMFALVENVLYAVSSTNRKKIAKAFVILNDEIINLIMVDKFKESKTISKENLEILQFVYKLISNFSKNYKNVYKNTIRRCPTFQFKKHTGTIAIIEEWKEILEMYIKGKLELQEKLCHYLSIDVKSKLEFIVQELKAGHMPLSQLEKKMRELLNKVFKYLIDNFTQRNTQADEYIKLIKVTSTDLTFNSSIGKLKYINLVEGQDAPITEDLSTDDEKTPRKFSVPKNEEFLNESFGVCEPLIESYLCALHWRLILQGRLYITNSCLCFYSAFNNETLFGQSTRIAIPFCDIIEVKKEANALIFDNAISIRTAESEFFFSSFLYRDSAYDLISKLCEEAEKPNLKLQLFKKPLLLPSLTTAQPQETSNTFLATIKKIEKERLKDAIERYGLRMPSSAPYLDETYDCPIQLLAVALIDKLHPTSLLALEKSGNKNIVIESKQIPPKYFTSYQSALKEVMKGNRENFLKEVLKWPISTDVKVKYTHRLSEVVPIPFVPKEFSISEIGSVYYLSPNYMIIFLKMMEYGIPYSDYFATHEWLEVTQNTEKGEYKTRWRIYVEIDFIKKTMFQHIIENIGLIKINKILGDNRIIYKDYIDKELPRFYRIINDQLSTKDVIKGWRPSINKSIVSELIIRQFFEKYIYTEQINHLLRNQKKICVMLILAIIICIIIFKL